MSEPALNPSSRRVAQRTQGRRVRLAPVLGALAVAALAGCGAPVQGPAAGAGAVSRPRVWRPAKADTLGPVVAVVGGRHITRHAVDSLLGTAPAQIQAQYRSSPDQYRALVERMVDNEALHQAALRDSIERDPAYQAELGARAYELAIKYYYQRQVIRAPEPADSEITAYYDEHSKDFDVPGRVRVRHILLRTEAQAKAARRRLTGGATWVSVCAKESKDELTKKNEGILGYVASDSDLVPGVGKAPALAAAVFALKEGEVSRPVRTEKGWHLLMTDDRHEASRRPLSEVRDRIASEIKVRLNDEFAQALIDSLKKFSGAAIFEDSIAVALQPARTPEQLFEQAQAAALPSDRIALYRQLLSKHPGERVSEQAAFMIGFTYAEELGDYEAARTAFEEFIRTHPKSDLVSSARWMLQNMEKPNPPFEGEVPPDSTESQEGESSWR